MKSSILTFLSTAWVVCALLPTLARGQSDTLTISGTFQMDAAFGSLGADLAGVYARGGDHTWTLTLDGVTYENDYSYQEWDDPLVDGGYAERYVTRAFATSFTLEFFGPDAATLNNVVSGQLIGGGLTNGAVVELENGDYFDWRLLADSGPYSTVSIGLTPLDFENGIAFSGYAYEYEPSFTPVYPGFEPRRVTGVWEWINDERFPNSGEIQSYEQVVDIGSYVPPPSLPQVSILDASVVEGNKGTTRLELTVNLSGASGTTITVQYQTSDGTAKAQSDYAATSGNLTFQPGDTSRTITIPVKADRKREPHETFTVQLSIPVGATINDGVATATILNDD